MSSPTDPAAHASVMLEYSAGELAAYKFLTTVEGRAALEACRQLPTLAVSDILRLRKQWGELRAQALIAQHALTGSLIEKFGNADRLATNRSLQQASDAITAAYKAERFPRDANVIDWCCGMGGDLTALSMRTSARGIDRDPWLCLMASANAPRAQVVCGDVTEHLPTQHDFLHADPDRRPGEQKTSQPEFGSPPLEIIDRAIHVAAGAAIKLAPAAEVPAHWSLSAERQWISLQGSCRQQIVWFGLTNDPGKHRATRLNRQGQASEFCAVPIDRCDVTDQIGRYLYDPDPALRAAQLTCCWAVKFQTAALGGPQVF